VLKFAPWSFSKHDTLLSCPSLFNRSYVLHDKGVDDSSPSRVGTAVHSVLEEPVASDGVPVSDADRLDHHAAGANFTPEEHEKSRTFLDQVKKYKEWEGRFCAQHGVTFRRKELEAAIGVDFRRIGYNDPKALMRGKMDVVLLTGNNDLVIIDHKTGKKRQQDDHARQLYVYHVFGVALFPNVRAVQCAIHHVVDGSFDWEPPRPADLVRKQLHPWLTHYLNKHDPALRAILNGVAPTKPSWKCGFCKYKNACEAGIAENAQRAAEKERKKLKVVSDGT
jgi:RecB family exonuclease